MTEQPLTVRTRIAKLDLTREDQLIDFNDGRKGYVDVRYYLESGDNLLGVADVRVYFKRTDISLDALTSAALGQGHQILSQIAQHYKSDPSDASPEQLW